MKYIKVGLVAVLSTLICLSFAAPLSAKGETSFRYAYVDEGVTDAYFYRIKDPDASLFAIPDTYCVEILQEDGDWYKCRYAKDEGKYFAVEGYCLKSKLKPIAEPLENEYLNCPIEVEFSADKANPSFPFKIKLTLPYYGKGKMNASDLLCVYYGGEFMYVADEVPPYDRNPIPQPTLSTDVKRPENSLNATLITAAVITAVAVIAVVVLYFAGKRPKLPPKNDT